MRDMTLPDHYDDLEGTLRYVRRFLEGGVVNRRLASHAPALATIAEDGAPSVRTVVLRGVEWDAQRLRIHTDVRSRKWHEVARDERVVLHCYDAKAKLQLRIEGSAEPHHRDEASESAWAGSRPMSRACYRVVQAPGTALGEPQDVVFEDDERPDAGREHFGVIRIVMSSIEYLYLAAAGHRRALFTFRENDVDRQWLTP